MEIGKEIVSLADRNTSLSYHQALIYPFTERLKALIVDELVDGPVIKNRLQFRFKPGASLVDARGCQLHKLRDEGSCRLAKHAVVCAGRIVISVSMENVVDYQK
jgi:hypothetical protein